MKIVNWGRNDQCCYSSIQSGPNVTPLCQTTDTPNIDQSLSNLVKFLFKVISFNRTKKNWDRTIILSYMAFLKNIYLAEYICSKIMWLSIEIAEKNYSELFLLACSLTSHFFEVARFYFFWL